MQQAQRALQHDDQHLLRRGLGLRIVPVQPQLGDLQEPVAVLSPEEVVDLPPRLAVLEVLQQPVDVGGEAAETAEDPALREF